MFQPYKFEDLIAKPVVTPDPFTLASLIEWLERKSANATYNWHDCDGRCLFSQYLYSIGLDGFTEYLSGSVRFRDTNGITVYKIAGYAPHTFGAALERARAVQS